MTTYIYSKDFMAYLTMDLGYLYLIDTRNKLVLPASLVIYALEQG